MYLSITSQHNKLKNPVPNASSIQIEEIAMIHITPKNGHNSYLWSNKLKRWLSNKFHPFYHTNDVGNGTIHFTPNNNLAKMGAVVTSQRKHVSRSDFWVGIKRKVGLQRVLHARYELVHPSRHHPYQLLPVAHIFTRRNNAMGAARRHRILR